MRQEFRGLIRPQRVVERWQALGLAELRGDTPLPRERFLQQDWQGLLHFAPGQMVEAYLDQSKVSPLAVSHYWKSTLSNITNMISKYLMGSNGRKMLQAKECRF